MREQVDLVVVGGGINGAGVARDAAGRGLSVLLAERGDYGGETSSSSSKLIHGGLRYLETFQFALVREALREREVLMWAAPHIMEPLRFLLPMSGGQPRPAWMVRLGLWLYDLLAGRGELPGSGRLDAAETARIPHLRGDRYRVVLHYADVLTDDARLVLETLLDARAHGAEVRNYCEVMAIDTVANGYTVTLKDDRGTHSVQTRFVVNAAGPWANVVRTRMSRPGRERDLQFVRGSHIVLPMPDPPLEDALTLQQSDERVVFVLPWLGRYLAVGTTEVLQDSPNDETACSDAERDYLLAAVNAALDIAAGTGDVVWHWSGVRPLVDNKRSDRPSRTSRGSRLEVTPNGRGGCVTIYGGKITTYRRLAERVMDELRDLGASMGPDWTKTAPLHGGTMTRRALARLADAPGDVPSAVARRWVYTYGDATRDLMARLEDKPWLGEEVAQGVPLVELEHAWSVEDARTATDFLTRRTKLNLTLDEREQSRIEQWFAEHAHETANQGVEPHEHRQHSAFD